MQQKYCCLVSQLYEDTMVEVYTNVTSVAFIVVNNHQNNVNSTFLSHQLPNGARCPNFDLSLYLHPFYVCESSEGSGDSAPKHIQ